MCQRSWEFSQGLLPFSGLWSRDTVASSPRHQDLGYDSGLSLWYSAVSIFFLLCSHVFYWLKKGSELTRSPTWALWRWWRALHAIGNAAHSSFKTKRSGLCTSQCTFLVMKRHQDWALISMVCPLQNFVRPGTIAEILIILFTFCYRRRRPQQQRWRRPSSSHLMAGPVSIFDGKRQQITTWGIQDLFPRQDLWFGREFRRVHHGVGIRQLWVTYYGLPVLFF